MFDHAIVLTSHPGRCVYNGLMKELREHFPKVGPLCMHITPCTVCAPAVEEALR